jgi:hypothetical protein
MLRSWIVERLSSSIKHEYNKELEEHKAKLKASFDTELEVRKASLKAQSDAELEIHKANTQRLVHIDQSHFDMEVKNFKALWSAICAAVDLTAKLAHLYSFEERQEAKGEKRKYATDADEAFFECIRIIQELRPFIPRNIHEKARELAMLCKREIDQFFNAVRMEERLDNSYDQVEAGKVAKKEKETIHNKWNELADSMYSRIEAIPGEQVKNQSLSRYA